MPQVTSSSSWTNVVFAILIVLRRRPGPGLLANEIRRVSTKFQRLPRDAHRVRVPVPEPFGQEIYSTVVVQFRCNYAVQAVGRSRETCCPFPRFLPLGRISCEGAGNGHFLIIVVNFGFRALWADLTLLCVKMCRFFWAEIPGKKEIPGKRAEIPGQIHHDSKMKTWSGMFFLEMDIFILKLVNLQKMVRNQTKICPGKKFVTNEYPGIYIYINIYIYIEFERIWHIHGACSLQRVISEGVLPPIQELVDRVQAALAKSKTGERKAGKLI